MSVHPTFQDARSQEPKNTVFVCLVLWFCVSFVSNFTIATCDVSIAL